MFRIAIVEDDETSAAILGDYIKKYENKSGYQFTCARYNDGLDFISEYKPIYDIVFMDIKMPHLDGMKSSKELRKIDQNVALVFVTNFKQYAIKGYEVNALDFIVKPMEYYDFEMKFIKAIEYAMKHQNATIAIKTGDTTKIILLMELYYVEVLNHRLIYHTEKGSYETYGLLTKVEESLSSKGFARCSNSYFVNLRHVMEVHLDYIVVGGDNVPISRRKKKEFMKVFTEYMGGGVS